MKLFHSKPTHPLTAEQQAIVNSTEDAVLVNAVAGSGKTSTLMELAKKYNNGLYLAFNKSIVNDVVPKLPVGWECKTFNALGLALTKQMFPDIKVNFKKYNTSDPVAKLAVCHMTMGGGTSLNAWQKTAQRFNIERYHIADSEGLLEAYKADTTNVSGEEMLQYPIDYNLRTEAYDIILVDECQDLNAQQLNFLLRIRTKRIVFVGDINQAIYGFRGSDTNVFKKIESRYAITKYQLTQSFRCPQNVVQVVADIVPHMTSQKTGGLVQRTHKNKVIYPEECFILARTNGILINLAHEFLQNGMHFSISSPFASEIAYLAKKFINKSNDIDTAKRSVLAELGDKARMYQHKGWESNHLQNKYMSVYAMLERCSTAKDIDDFVSKIKLHTDSSSTRKLMTIHASKGLEHENVIFVAPSICKQFAQKANQQWAKQEESNLYYVACTRAIENLTLVHTE